jgi:hypothetical protein
MIRALRLVPRVIGRGHRGYVEALRIVEIPFVSHAMVVVGGRSGRSLGADWAREIVAPQLPLRKRGPVRQGCPGLREPWRDAFVRRCS